MTILAKGPKQRDLCSDPLAILSWDKWQRENALPLECHARLVVFTAPAGVADGRWVRAFLSPAATSAQRRRWTLDREYAHRPEFRTLRSRRLRRHQCLTHHEQIDDQPPSHDRRFHSLTPLSLTA